MLLIYKNLTIRNASISDRTLLSQWWNDGKVMEHAGFPNGTGQTPNDIVESLLQDTDDTYRRLIIESDGIAIGEMNYRNKGNAIAEIGINWVKASHQLIMNYLRINLLITQNNRLL